MLEAIFYTTLKRLRMDTPVNEDDGVETRYYAVLDVGADISAPNQGRGRGDVVEISVPISRAVYDELANCPTNYGFQAKADLSGKA
jgi:hypothetical protein